MPKIKPSLSFSTVQNLRNFTPEIEEVQNLLLVNIRVENVVSAMLSRIMCYGNCQKYLT